MNDDAIDGAVLRDLAAHVEALEAGETCPLCGQKAPHRHTPEEIVIYGNGIKRGRAALSTDALPVMGDGCVSLEGGAFMLAEVEDVERLFDIWAEQPGTPSNALCALGTALAAWRAAASGELT